MSFTRWRSLVDGTEVDVGLAIPDSAIAHFDASDESTIITSDGNVVEWHDKLGNYDLTGEALAYEPNGINNLPSVEFDGVDNALSAEFSDPLQQPNTVFAVVQFLDDDLSEFSPFFGSEGDSEHAMIQGDSDGFQRIDAGEFLRAGDTTNDALLFTAVFDEADSLIREDGVETGSGNAGSGSLDGLQLGAEGGPFDQHYEGYISEVVPCDGRLSQSDIEDEEQRLANKWEISLA